MHTIAQLSDCHIRPAADPLVGGVVDTRAILRRALAVLTSWDLPVDTWLFTGDLADDGQPESYAWLRETVEPLAAARGVRVVWASGNHDARPAFRRLLLDAVESDEPLNQAVDLGGLRLLVLDTNVTGVPWGRPTRASLDWLAEQLATPAHHGTLLALHHSPITPWQDAVRGWDLREPDALAAVLRGSDVRLLVGGHFHQTSWGTFAGIPVAGCTSLAYTQDLSRGRTLRGQDAGQGFNLIQLTDAVAVHHITLARGAGVHPEVAPDASL